MRCIAISFCVSRSTVMCTRPLPDTVSFAFVMLRQLYPALRKRSDGRFYLVWNTSELVQNSKPFFSSPCTPFSPFTLWVT